LLRPEAPNYWGLLAFYGSSEAHPAALGANKLIDEAFFSEGENFMDLTKQ